MSAFDGLTFKQGLTKVGFPDDQAEALSALIRDHVVGNAATKDDLLGAEQRLNEKIERVQERLKAEMTLLRNEAVRAADDDQAWLHGRGSGGVDRSRGTVLRAVRIVS